MSRFEQEYFGRGTKDVHAHVIGDLLVVRLQGVLTDAEQHLATRQPVERGRELLKQVRAQPIEVARPKLAVLIEDITGSERRSMHRDSSTLTGETIVVFALAEMPQIGEPKKQ